MQFVFVAFCNIQLAKRHERREEAQKSLEQAEAAGMWIMLYGEQLHNTFQCRRFLDVVRGVQDKSIV